MQAFHVYHLTNNALLKVIFPTSFQIQNGIHVCQSSEVSA